MSTPIRTLLALPCLAAAVSANQLAFTEVMYNPPAGKPEFVEVLNLTSNRIDMARWTLSGGVEMTLPDFNSGATAAHFLNEYERIVLSSADETATRAAYPGIPPNVRVFGPWTGSLDNNGESIVLRDAAGSLQTELTYGDSGRWPRAADGAGHSLQIINQDRKVDDWRNWRASAQTSGSPGFAEPASPEQPVGNPEQDVRPVIVLRNYTDSWKYWRDPADPDGANPEGSWMGTAFNDAAWPSGNGFLGHETTAGVLPPLLQTSFATGYASSTLTYYFRSSFIWNGPLTGNNFVLDQYIDDGVVYYLNGQELKAPGQGRVRMNAGVPTHSTQASGLPGSGDAFEELEALTGSLDGQLVNGTNYFCAEVHQSGTGSSDIFFGARLKVVGNAPNGVIINEVKPGTAGNGFVEFYNPTASSVDLQNWYLTDETGNLTKFQITASTVVPAMGFASVGYEESNLGLSTPVRVILTQPDGTTRQNFIESTMAIDGRSLGRKPAGSASWFLFSGPTPGAANFSSGGGGGPAPLYLSEAHFGINGRVDWVEIYNPGPGAFSAAGFFVSSLPDLSDKVALNGSVAAGGYASAVVDFATDADGDATLYLSDSANNILAAVDVEARPGLPSMQAWPAGSSEWYAAATDTRDAANNPARSTAIVINEIMYEPPSKHSNAEFVEIMNRSSTAVDIGGWRFTSGLNYTFPPGTSIAPGEYLVVGSDPAWLTATYGGGVRVFGPATGTLRNSGELIRLEDANQNLADAVDYKSGGQWPSDAEGAGSSLELIHPDMDNSQPSSWRASNESAKSSFQTFSHTGLYREMRTGTAGSQANGRPLSETRELLLNLVSDGYIQMRNVSLTKSTAPATNLLVGGDATSHDGTAVSGFHAKGTHRLSDTIGGVFHLISKGGGDTKGNLIERDVTGIAANDTLTLTFEARWISGLPLLVAQTWDRSFGKVFRLPIPNNLGSPGAANTVLRAAVPPAVDGIRHSPAVPTSTQPVVVTARVSSTAALTSVELRERVDTVAGNGAWNTIAMNDSGTGGDAAAGDGIYSATVAARAEGTITQFYVRATAANGQVNECPRDGEGVNRVNGATLEVPRRPAMWIVDNSPPSTQPGILSERHIFSLYDRNAMNTGTGYSSTYDWDFPRPSNFGLNSTVIMNESDVMYNCEIRKGGSPWTRNGNNSMERLRWKPPGDDQFRGRSRYAIDSDGSATNTEARFHNRFARYLLYLFGYPIPDAEFVQVTINGDTTTWRDSMELTDTDFFDRAYGGGGELFEIDDAWYMYDTNNGDDRLDAGQVTARWAFTDWANGALVGVPSTESPIFYHGNWPLRFPEGSYDYAALTSLMTVAINNNSTVLPAAEAAYREQMERMMDTDRAAIYTAVRGYLADWDNFTRDRGKNGYFYRRPTDGKFEFHHWDSDLGWQTGQINSGFIGSVGGIGWTNYSNRPWFQQKFRYYLSELITRYTGGSPRTAAWLTAMNYQSGNAHANAPFKTNAYNYAVTWFPTRDTNAVNFIGTANLNRAFTVSTAGNQTVATPVFSISGNASTRTAYVEVAGHPEAVFSWVPTAGNYSPWTVTGLRLQNGLNALTIRAIGGDGAELASLPFNVTLSVNAPPVAVITAAPPSLRVEAGELITLDATASSDPEATALSFAWTVNPVAGAAIAHSVPGKTEARFTIPGIYTVSVNVTDGGGAATAASVEVTVFNANDFTSFGGGFLPGSPWTVQNAELRDNFSASAWYSIEDTTGRLLLQVLDDSAKPLVSSAATHPLVTRDLPDSSDFVLQTDFEPDTREFVNWHSGLWLQFNEGGSTVTYTYGLNGGTSLVVNRAALPAAFTAASTFSGFTGSGATLRVRRTGTSLHFQRYDGAAWVNQHTQTIPAGASALTGGVFAASAAAINARTSFDYILLADPANLNPVLAALRITEVHYNPAAGGVEFIELRNTGAQPISLAGVYFGDGQPFSTAGVPTVPYTFGAETLAPGEFIVVTENNVAFQALYGNTARLAPAWTAGNLSNGGETITLHDASGNVIHDFAYDDIAPWPLAADGTGPSMEVIDINADYNDGANWRASGEPAGSPGYQGLGPDSDGDGYADSVEALFGTGANDRNSSPLATAATNGSGHVTVSWPFTAGVTYDVEYSADLVSWSVLQTVTGTGTWTDTATAVNQRRCYRVTARMP